MNGILDKQIKYGVAKDWTKNWREKHPECKAFLIPVEDLMGLLLEMRVLKVDIIDNKTYFSYDAGKDRDVRGYMGYDPTGGDKKKGEYHMVLVGTEKFKDPRFKSGYVYRDIYKGGVDGNPNTLDVPYLTDGDNSGVFDFSAPCPDDCDDKSGLNGND